MCARTMWMERHAIKAEATLLQSKTTPQSAVKNGDAGAVINIRYTNHRRETAYRRIRPIRIWYGSTPWHSGDQWFLDAFDLEKNEERSFAMIDIRAWDIDPTCPEDPTPRPEKAYSATAATLPQLVAKYSNAVGRYGPDSEQAKQVRADHADDAEFLQYADALDRVKRHLGGSGIDSTSPEDPTP